MVEDRTDREGIARRRIINILRAHGVAVMRTLEQKISDAGPHHLRVDPHIIGNAREALLAAGRIALLRRKGQNWYHLPETDPQTVTGRYAEQEPILSALQQNDLPKRIGQALEIAVFRLLSNQPLGFLGHFYGLDSHGDGQLYRKLEPPSAVSGKELPQGKALDFIVVSSGSGLAGIEVKNTRAWIYPDHSDLREFLWKCCCLDVVPVLIARRIQYSTFTVLNPCGLVIHQTYNQRFPMSDRELALKVKDKTLLGYHDIHLGNEPDPRLQRFLHENLPRILPERRRQFDKFKELISEYAVGNMSYQEFARRVRVSKQRLPGP